MGLPGSGEDFLCGHGGRRPAEMQTVQLQDDGGRKNLFWRRHLQGLLSPAGTQSENGDRRKRRKGFPALLRQGGL